MKYDGTHSAVTFICSKTDDISITEAADSLGIDAEVSGFYVEADKLMDYKVEQVRELRNLRDEEAALGEKLDQVDTASENWEALKSRLDFGEAVYPPPDSKKRKRHDRNRGSCKSRRSFDDFLSESDFEDDTESDEYKVNQSPLTAEDIGAKLSSLKTERKQIREDRQALRFKLEELQMQLDKIQAEHEELLAHIKAKCIKGRNEYSRKAIQQDFAMGIKEYVPLLCANHF